MSRHGGGAAVGVAGVIAAVVGLVSLLIAARVLTIADNSRFSVFWAVLFFGYAVVAGLAVETTRITSPTDSDMQLRSVGPTVASLMVPILMMILLISGLTMPAWRMAVPAFKHDDGWLLGIALVIGITGYAGQSFTAGALTGAGRLHIYAAMLFAEAGSRLILLLVVALLRPTVVALAFAVVAAELVWAVILLPNRNVRMILAERIGESKRQFVKRSALAMIGLGVSSVLVVGFSWLLDLTTPDAILLGAAPLMLAISLTRAPIMVPISALYNVVVAYFVRARARRSRMMTVMLTSITAIGLVGAILAWWIGPWLLGLLRADYVLPGLTLSALTLGAMCTAMITVTGVVCQASARYTQYLVGWLVAVAVAVAMLCLPLPIGTRAVLALIVGPVCGMATHLAFIWRSHDVASLSVPDEPSSLTPDSP